MRGTGIESTSISVNLYQTTLRYIPKQLPFIPQEVRGTFIQVENCRF
jgi:hypothetical protein